MLYMKKVTFSGLPEEAAGVVLERARPGGAVGQQLLLEVGLLGVGEAGADHDGVVGVAQRPQQRRRRRRLWRVRQRELGDLEDEISC